MLLDLRTSTGELIKKPANNSMSKKSRRNALSEGRFVISGKNVVFEALKKNVELDVLHVYKKIGDGEMELILNLARENGVNVRFSDRDEIDRISGSLNNQGVCAFVRKFTTLDLNGGISQLKGITKPRLVIALDSINDPQNLGSIIRTSAAAKVDMILINQARSCPLSEAVFKVSQGGIFHVPIISTPNLVEGIKRFKDIGFWVYGFEAFAPKLYFAEKFTKDVVLVFGSEGEGLRELTKKSCDLMLKIPISGEISSLNVSIATALGIFEVLRQRES